MKLLQCLHHRPLSACTICAPVAEAMHAASEKVREIEKQNSMTFSLPFCPPSVNSLYSVSFKGKGHPPDIHLKDECRRWRNEAMTRIPRFRIEDDSALSVTTVIYYPWFTKAKTWAKRDLDNMGKLLHDTIAKRLNIDDRRFKAVSMRSVNSAVERTVVTLVEVPIAVWSQEQ